MTTAAMADKVRQMIAVSDDPEERAQLGAYLTMVSGDDSLLGEHITDGPARFF